MIFRRFWPIDFSWVQNPDSRSCKVSLWFINREKTIQNSLWFFRKVFPVTWKHTKRAKLKAVAAFGKSERPLEGFRSQGDFCSLCYALLPWRQRKVRWLHRGCELVKQNSKSSEKMNTKTKNKNIFDFLENQQFRENSPRSVRRRTNELLKPRCRNLFAVRNMLYFIWFRIFYIFKVLFHGIIIELRSRGQRSS